MKPGCEPAIACLAELVAGDLPPAEMETVRAHLAGCADCRAEEASMREVLALMQEGTGGEGLGGGVPDPGPVYWSAFAARVTWARAASDRARKTEKRRASRWSRATPSRVALAASIVLVALLAFLMQRGPRVDVAGVSEFDESEEALLAALAPNDPVDDLAGFSGEEMERFEEVLFAKGAKKKTAPTTAKGAPTPVPTPAKAPKADGASSDVVDPATPGAAYDDLLDLDDLSPEELDELMKRLDAIKT